MYAERQGSFAKQEENVKVIENLEKTIRELKTEISVINGKVTTKHQNYRKVIKKIFFSKNYSYVFDIIANKRGL